VHHIVILDSITHILHRVL